MKKRRSIENKNIQRYMLRTYLILVCISVFIEIILCIYMVGSARKHMVQNHGGNLDQIVYQMDESFAKAEGQSNQLSQDNQVQQVLGFRGTPEYHGENILKIRDMMDNFEDIESNYPEIKSIFFVDKRQNIIIDSGKILHGEEILEYLSGRGLNLPLLIDIQKERKSMLYAADCGTADCRIFYMAGIFKNSYNRPDGYLATELDREWIDSRLALYGRSGGQACYLVSKGQGYVGADEWEERLVSAIAEEGSLSGSVSFEGKRYVYTIRSSEYMGLDYYFVTTPYTYYRDVYITLIFTAISMVMLLAVSILFARMFTKRNTEPLHRILETMQDSGQKEYSFTYETIMQEVAGLTGKVRNYEDRQSRDFLSQIFSGQARGEKELLAYQEKYAPELEQGFYVLGVRLMGLTELSDFDILVFCISNIFGEMLEGYTRLHPVENWDRVYFLVGEKSEGLEEKVCQSIQYLEGRLSINVACGFSGRLSRFTELKEGKQQADYTTEYQELNQQFSKPLWYEDMMAMSLLGETDYSSDLKKMMHLVMAREYEGSMELLEEMWKNAADSAYQDISVSRARMLTLMSIITIPYKEKYGQTGTLQKGAWRTLPEIYQASREMLQKLNQTEDETGGKTTFEQMRAYIAEHALDPAITAGSVSDAFHLTASYASGMFKRYAGEGILDAIHRERIRHAKLFLKEGLAVQETAIRTGYLDSRGFIRAFKKYEGITPGQYKSIEEREK
ncbi:MAG: helix-turn-helix transcriptional regulator [Lachnospiraceae bacterium]|nr:helix-turn-helix transcriptional regulator [Lachnospiraceae bacterium]